MKRIPIVLKMAFSLSSLSVSIVFLAVLIGLVPDKKKATLQGRKALCDQMAIFFSYAVQRQEIDIVMLSLQAAKDRNPDLLSASVRTVDGRVIFESSGSGKSGDSPSISSPGTEVRVPIALNDRPWGTIELQFRPVDKGSLWISREDPLLPLLVFTWTSCTLLYYFYLGRLFRKGAGNSAVPQRVRTTLNTLSEGVVILDKDLHIAMANESFATLVGKPSDELQGYSVSDLSWVGYRDQPATAGIPWLRAISEGSTQSGTILHLDKKGTGKQTLSVNSSPILGEDGGVRGVLATFDNLTQIEKKNSRLRKLLLRLRETRVEIMKQNERLQALATRDPLTNCLNRRAFFQQFESLWESCCQKGEPLSCILVDVDFFKSINDNHGHSVGDKVLQNLGEILNSIVRKTDVVCRYGGEEFCIVLPRVDMEAALAIGERYRLEITTRPCGAINVTASFGVSSSRLGAADPRQLLDQADQSLYAAKRGGRNRVFGWSSELSTKNKRIDPPATSRSIEPVTDNLFQTTKAVQAKEFNLALPAKAFAGEV